ncbi:MAG: SiaB family protein kinase [Bacteroidales bacterium]
MSFNFDEYYQKLNTGNVVLSYKGNITTEMINSTLESIETIIGEGEQEGKLRKKVYNVLVESLQNLYHHTDELPDELRATYHEKFGVVVISKDENGIRITTGNFIPSARIKFLKDKIDKINSLSQEELKDMYKFILNHQKLSEKGGGGLGLVDIARKTGNKLEYNFINVNNDFYFFNLNILITN